MSAQFIHHVLQDNIDEALIKIFYDRLCSSNTVPCELHATIQCRLMLRVLRDNLANINQSTLDALNCLATYSAGEATTFPPLARPEDLRPSLELLLLVKTYLVLSSAEDVSQALGRLFPDDPNLTAEELARRQQLFNAIDNPPEQQRLLMQYSQEASSRALAAYVEQARTALGPTLLQEMQDIIGKGECLPFNGKALHRHANDMEARRAASGGQYMADEPVRVTQGDPLSSVWSTASQASHNHSSVLAATQAMAPGMWNPSAALAAPPEAHSSGSKRNKLGQHRRKNGRWTQEETQLLIELTNKYGKGKWKKIVQEGGEMFQNRTAVDLKDKWRNLEKQNAVPGGLDTPGGGSQGMGMADMNGTPVDAMVLQQQMHEQQQQLHAQLQAQLQQAGPQMGQQDGNNNVVQYMPPPDEAQLDQEEPQQ